MKRNAAQAGRMARRKGMVFQNKVAAMLRDAWGLPVLWTPMSGGLSMKGDLTIGGDPPDHVLAYSVECRNRQDVTLRTVLKDPNRLPVSDKQIVFFKEDGGIVWLGFDVIKGPGLAPVQFSMKFPPAYVRVKGPDDGDTMVGLVCLSGHRGVEYLTLIRKVLVRQVVMRQGRPMIVNDGTERENE